MFFHHALPGARIAVLEGETLGVRAVAQDHRIAAGGERVKHIGAQHKPVIHRDRHVPVDAHAVAHFAALPMRRAGRRPGHPRFAFARRHAFLLFIHFSRQAGERV